MVVIIFSYLVSVLYNVVKTVNTYAWIILTLNSKIIKILWLNTINKTRNKFISGPVEEIKVINKWPAIILADNRTAKVSGRIKFLIDSINTIKGINTEGVPWGTKWINIWSV